jgi:hypothetical protein
MIDGKVKASSVISRENIVAHGPGGVVDTTFIYEDSSAFRRDLQQFFRDAPQNP